MLRRALGTASGLREDEVRAISRRCNDAGLAAREIMAGRSGKGTRDLEAVEDLFDQLAAARGPVKKQAVLEMFFGHCAAVEASYVVRILTGDLRIGLKEGLLEEAIIAAFGAEPDAVRHAGMLLGDTGALAVAAKNRKLGEAGLRVFHPVKCMLAGSEPDGQAVWQRLAGEERMVWAEDKYDGIRAQVHVADGRCEIFSRDLRRITAQFPEIVEAAVKLRGSVVLDGEILASVAGRRLTFFDLQKRLNRREADLFLTEDVPVEFAAFDVLLHERMTTLDRPWRERRAILEKLPLSKPMALAPVTRLASAEAVEEEFRAARGRGNEGLVGKDPGSTYTPGRRGLAWIKLKKNSPRWMWW